MPTKSKKSKPGETTIPDLPKLWKLSLVTERAGAPRSSIQGLIDKGILPVVKLGGRLYVEDSVARRFLAGELEAPAAAVGGRRS